MPALPVEGIQEGILSSYFPPAQGHPPRFLPKPDRQILRLVVSGTPRQSVEVQDISSTGQSILYSCNHYRSCQGCLIGFSLEREDCLQRKYHGVPRHSGVSDRHNWVSEMSVSEC